MRIHAIDPRDTASWECPAGHRIFDANVDDNCFAECRRCDAERELVEAADILRRDYAQRDAGSISSKRLRCDVERVLAALSRLEEKS